MRDHRHECSVCDGKGYFCREHGCDTDNALWCDEHNNCDVVACDYCEGEGSQLWDFDPTGEGICHRCGKGDIVLMEFTDCNVCKECFTNAHDQLFPDCKWNDT